MLISGPPPDDVITKQDRIEALRGTLQSEGWRLAIRPKLERELAAARSRLEDAEDIDKVREAQAEIRLLRRMTENPEGWFKP